MIWDTCCILESIKIGRINVFLSKIDNMVFLGEVLKEIKEKDMVSFLKEAEPIVEKYKLNMTKKDISGQRDYFLSNATPTLTKSLKSELREVIKEISTFKFKVGNGDRDILVFCKQGGSSVITHDSNLCSIVCTDKEHLYLIEFVMKNWDKLEGDIDNNILSYLYYGCLLALSKQGFDELKKKHGQTMAIQLYRKKIKIMEFLKKVNPLNNATINASGVFS